MLRQFAQIHMLTFISQYVVLYSKDEFQYTPNKGVSLWLILLKKKTFILDVNIHSTQAVQATMIFCNTSSVVLETLNSI